MLQLEIERVGFEGIRESCRHGGGGGGGDISSLIKRVCFELEKITAERRWVLCLCG